MTMQTIEKMELDSSVISFISKENKEALNIIVVINYSDYLKISNSVGNKQWEFKYINIALNIKTKKILETSEFTTNNNYKLPTFYNRNLIITIYINDSELEFNSKYFISPSIKRNIINALNIDQNKLDLSKLKLK